MSPDAEKRVAELEAKVDDLERIIVKLTTAKTAKGNQEFIDNDVVVLRKLYAQKVYTKRSGTYVELTS